MIELTAGIWFRFFIAALATWRLSFLFAREDGPWRIFVRLRRVAGRFALGRALGCVKCMSVWFAVPLALFVGGSLIQVLVIWLGLSGVAALIDEWTRSPFEWKEQPQNELLQRGSDSAVNSTASNES
jgi:hypothetical protein